MIYGGRMEHQMAETCQCIALWKVVAMDDWASPSMSRTVGGPLTILPLCSCCDNE